MKLIASDVDGTLLRYGQTRLDERTFDVIRACKAKGILFAVASGRQYPNLKRLFAPVWQDLVIIAENGALMLQNDQLLHKASLPKKDGLAVLDSIEEIPGCRALLSGQNTCYIRRGQPEYLAMLADFCGNTVTTVDSFATVEEDFLKIALFTRENQLQQTATSLNQRWKGKHSFMVSGLEWVDLNHTGKEDALALLLQKQGLTADDLMVFGDNFNDEGMMRLAGSAWAMDTSHASLQALCGQVCQNPVQEIERLLATL